MIGVYGAFVGAAAGSGPFVGGLIIHELGWCSIFYLNLPIGGLGIVLTAILLRPSQPDPRPLDVASHLLLMRALSGVSFALIKARAGVHPGGVGCDRRNKRTSFWLRARGQAGSPDAGLPFRLAVRACSWPSGLTGGGSRVSLSNLHHSASKS